MVTSAARPHVFWATRERVRGWPIGAALLETLSHVNPDVRDALEAERARLSRDGYPDDLPLPALWWPPEARDELVEIADAPRIAPLRRRLRPVVAA
ncbi:MAG: hypothetical protein ACJ75G_02955 [Gaiellaceae bacterium]